MNQKSLSVFITPEELGEIIYESATSLGLNLLKMDCTKYYLCEQEFIEESKYIDTIGFALGYYPVDELLLSNQTGPWEAGFILIDNPVWSEKVLREVQIAIKTDIPTSEAYEKTMELFTALVRRIKKISTRGKYLALIWGNRMDTYTWLSEGALLKIRSGYQVTQSAPRRSEEEQPVVVHKLIENNGY